MDFRVFLVVAIEVEKRRSGKNGRKWSKMGCRGYLVGNGFPRFLRRGHRGGQEDHGRNGRKWQKKGCRGYLVGNGFPRFLRHSPTTFSYGFFWNQH